MSVVEKSFYPTRKRYIRFTIAWGVIVGTRLSEQVVFSLMVDIIYISVYNVDVALGNG